MQVVTIRPGDQYKDPQGVVHTYDALDVGHAVVDLDGITHAIRKTPWEATIVQAGLRKAQRDGTLNTAFQTAVAEARRAS